MPELPEVETVRRGLEPELLGRVVGKCWTDWPRVIEGCSALEFDESMSGRTCIGLLRRGKYLSLDFDGLFLTVHLRMTGRLYISHNLQGDDRWVHFSLALDDGRYLVFSDARKFGRVQLSDSLDWLEAKLGPEPLGLQDKAFHKILSGSKRAVKVFLLDQKKLAGVGNIYADEALHKAGIHPQRPVDQLKRGERLALGAAVRQVLSQAIEHEGATISWYRKPDGREGESQKHFTVYGRGGEPCFSCGHTISKIVLGQRGTHFCGNCQK